MTPLAVHGPGALRAAVAFEDLMGPVADALVAFSRGLGASTASVFAPSGDGDVHVKSACLPGRPIFTVKVATWFATARPPGGGFVAAFDAPSGRLLALLRDEHHLSDVRTAAAGALAARALAREGAETVGVIGTGVQGYLQALAAASVRPVRRVVVWGRSPERARRLARALGRRLPGLPIEVAGRAEQAVAPADIVVTATSSARPLVEAGWLRPGQHVTAVGADDEHKCELEPGCLARADRLVVDSRELALRYGDVRHAVAAGALSAQAIDAELGEVLAGEAPGRKGDDQITIVKLVGLGVQDLAAAEVALDRLASGRPRHPAPASALDLEAP